MNTSEYYDDIWDRQKDIKEGRINVIPFPYDIFRVSIPGIMPGQMFVITAETKVGKTQFMSYTFLFQILDYAYEHPDFDVHIFYAALEEGEIVIFDRYLCHLAFRHFGVRINRNKLRGYGEDCRLSEIEIHAINNGRIKDKMQFMTDHVEFITDRSVDKILDRCYAYLSAHGSVNTHSEQVTDEYSGQVFQQVVFDSYTPHNQKLWNFVIIDHIGCVEYKNNDLKQEIDKLGQGLIHLRNCYKMTSIIVQQQSSTGFYEIKNPEDAKKMLASKDRLADSRYSAQNADYVIGLSSPYKIMKHLRLDLQIWEKKYNVGRLKNHLTVCELLLSRHGYCFSPIPLFFDGETCIFKEMPIFDENNEAIKEQELEDITKYAESLAPKVSLSLRSWLHNNTKG